jgi:hypothetical protein
MLDSIATYLFVARLRPYAASNARARSYRWSAP